MTRCSVPCPPPSLARTDIVAAWVHAIWIAKAASISSLGAAASIMASAAFKAISEMPPHGNWAAATAEPRDDLVMLPRVAIVAMPPFNQEILVAHRLGKPS